MGSKPDSQCPYCYQSIHYHAPNCHGQRIVKEIMSSVPLQPVRSSNPTEREKDWAELDYLRGEVARLREREEFLQNQCAEYQSAYGKAQAEAKLYRGLCGGLKTDQADWRKDIPDHPRGSTVSDITLIKAGYRMPEKEK